MLKAFYCCLLLVIPILLHSQNPLRSVDLGMNKNETLVEVRSVKNRFAAVIYDGKAKTWRVKTDQGSAGPFPSLPTALPDPDGKPWVTYVQNGKVQLQYPGGNFEPKPFLQLFLSGETVCAAFNDQGGLDFPVSVFFDGKKWNFLDIPDGPLDHRAFGLELPGQNGYFVLFRGKLNGPYDSLGSIVFETLTLEAVRSLSFLGAQRENLNWLWTFGSNHFEYLTDGERIAGTYSNVFLKIGGYGSDWSYEAVDSGGWTGSYYLKPSASLDPSLLFSTLFTNERCLVKFPGGKVFGPYSSVSSYPLVFDQDRWAFTVWDTSNRSTVISSRGIFSSFDSEPKGLGFGPDGRLYFQFISNTATGNRSYFFIEGEDPAPNRENTFRDFTLFDASGRPIAWMERDNREQRNDDSDSGHDLWVYWEGKKEFFRYAKKPALSRDGKNVIFIGQPTEEGSYLHFGQETAGPYPSILDWRESEDGKHFAFQIWEFTNQNHYWVVTNHARIGPFSNQVEYIWLPGSDELLIHSGNELRWGKFRLTSTNGIRFSAADPGGRAVEYVPHRWFTYPLPDPTRIFLDGKDYRGGFIRSGETNTGYWLIRDGKFEEYAW